MGAQAVPSLQGQRVVIVGGTSGIGLQTAFQAVEAGATAVGISRSRENVERARAKARGRPGAERISFEQGDGRNGDALRRLFVAHAPFDHVVVSVLDRGVSDSGPFRTIGSRGIEEGFHKFWISCRAIEAAQGSLREGGSITLLSGADERKAWPGVLAHAVVGGALKALVRTLAVELAPTRVNAVCPGPTFDPQFDPEERPERVAGLRRWGERFPLKRAGEASEVAQAILFLMTNTYTTGVILDVDGGASL